MPQEIRALAVPPKPTYREAQASAETSVMPGAACHFNHSPIISSILFVIKPSRTSLRLRAAGHPSTVCHGS